MWVGAILCTTTMYAQNDIAGFSTELALYKQKCEQLHRDIVEAEKKVAELNEESINNPDVQKLITQIEREIQKEDLPTGRMKKINNLVKKLNEYLPDQHITVNPQYRGRINQGENTPQPQNEQNKRPELNINEQPINNPPVDRDKIVRDYLSTYSLEQLYKNRSEVEKLLSECNDDELKDKYDTILKLFAIQYSIYDRPHLLEVFNKANHFKEVDLVKKEHLAQLVEELERVADYRRATIELKEMFEQVMNPNDDLKKKIIGRSTGKGDSTKAKDEMIIDPTMEEIMNFFVSTGGTKLIDQFEYTKSEFEEFMNKSQEEQRTLIQTLNDVLIKK